MTREEAIYVLKNTAWLGSEELVGDVSEAIQMAVNALKRSETPNNSDVISRQALCEYALNQKDKSVTPNDIMRFPSAQPERDIPKKPNETTDRAWGIPNRQAVCPNCDSYLGTIHFICEGDKRKVTYCDSCGQAIDWSEWEWDAERREDE